MSFSKLCILVMCALILAAGCRKKEEEPETEKKGQTQTTQQEQAPDGFARIADGLFMTRRPPRIEEYVNFLRVTGEPMPDWVDSPEVNYQDPITGLPRERTEAFATWKLLDVPTEQQWDNAADIVGDTPYPWGADATASTPIYLVRDWHENSAGHDAAVSEKQELLNEITSTRRSEVEMGRKMLNNIVDARTDEIQKQWQQLKTALSDLIEKRKENARQMAKARGQKTVLSFLERVGEEKKKVIHAKIKKDATPEDIQQAKENYEQFLEKQRNDLKELKTGVVEANQGLSEKARAMMEKFEARGEELNESLRSESSNFLPPEDEATDPQVLAERRKKLQKGLQDIKKMSADILADIEQAQQKIDQMSAELEKSTEEAPEQPDVQQKIEDIKQRIQDLNENIDADFVQEPHLFKELTEYADLAATKQALQAEGSTLEEVMGVVGTSETEEAPAEPAE